MAFFLHEWERLSWNFCFACWIVHRIDLVGPSARGASHILGFRLPIVCLTCGWTWCLGRECFEVVLGRCWGKQTMKEVFACMHAHLVQSCLTLWGPMDCSLPGSSVHGILQARILEGIAMPFSRDLPDPGTVPKSLCLPALADGFFFTGPPGKPKWRLDPQTNVNL